MIESSESLKPIKDLLKDGQFKKAYDILKTVELTTENCDSYYWCLAKYYLDIAYFENKVESTDLAINLLQEYLRDEVNYSNEDLWHLLLTCYLQKYDFEELFADCNYVISKLEKSDMAYSLMAQGLNNQGVFDNALNYINKAIELSRGKYAYYLLKYNILLGLNRKQDAYDEFLKAIVISKGGQFESRLQRFITSFGMNFSEPFLFNGMCQLNSLTYNSINPQLNDNYLKYKEYSKYFHFINLTSDRESIIKYLCHYLANDISIIQSNLNIDKLLVKEYSVTEVFLYFESAVRVLGYTIRKQSEYLQNQIDTWFSQIERFSNEELYLLSTLLTHHVKPVYDSPFFLKIMSSDNYISSIFKINNSEEANLFIKKQIQNLNLHNFGKNAENDLRILQKFLVLRHIYSLLETSQNSLLNFDFFNNFIITDITNSHITQKLRELEIQAILTSFTNEFNSKIIYNNSLSIEEEIKELKEVFLKRKEVLKSTYLSLKKYDEKNEEVTFEKAIALKIEKFDFANPLPYLLLLKLFYLENKISLAELIYLHFFTLTVTEIKGKGIKVFQETIIKGKEEILKSSIKLFGSMFMATIGFVSKVGDIIIAGFAASVGKLYESFLKQQSEEDLLGEVAIYDSFKNKFLIHISFLYESFGENKFKEIYLIDYSLLLRK